MKTPSWHWTKQPNAEAIKAKCIQNLQHNYWGGKTRPDMIGNENAKGTKHTEAWKQEASQRQTGNKHRLGKTPWNKGIHHTALSGSSNSNWKGGVSQQTKTARQLDMETVEYKNWRVSVFTRDNFTCQKCGVQGVKLNANHDLPYSKFPDLRLELLNGETLCEPCHKVTTKLQWEVGILV